MVEGNDGDLLEAVVERGFDHVLVAAVDLIQINSGLNQLNVLPKVLQQLQIRKVISVTSESSSACCELTAMSVCRGVRKLALTVTAKSPSSPSTTAAILGLRMCE